MAEFVKVFILILRGSVPKSFQANKKGLTIHIEMKNYLISKKIFFNEKSLQRKDLYMQ